MRCDHLFVNRSLMVNRLNVMSCRGVDSMGMDVRLNHHLMGSFMMHRFVFSMMRSNLMVHRCMMD